ncbi:Tropomyosin domain-containing protein [Dioscorea alata]|uniref:Tropomyosin domain-containing protein n=1 Tax=Dioscorea alata TaxID=55571 RepID=A0ACB7VTF2_DIOAL|nr:Tropomyosin domain-containing protein [Dioscorea alata]
MKRMMSKKSHSWWWDSHISPKNSKWLAENLEEMDKRVKSMLKLIDEEGDSFAKKAEMYYQRRPELVAHVEDFYRMYRALAERYDHVTGELRKDLQSELQSQGSGNVSDIGSEPPSPSVHSPELTPESKQSRPKPSPGKAAGFDFFLRSGGSSDVSRKGDRSSSSESSDSESEPENGKEINEHDITEGLNQRIVELENELHDVKEKLEEYEGSTVNGKCEHMEIDEYNSKISALEEELAVVSKRLRVSEALIVTLKQKLAQGNASLESEHGELDHERKQVLEMKERIAVLEAEVTDQKKVIEKLDNVIVDANKKFEAKLTNRDHAIEGYKAEIANASERFSQEKSRLEADVAKLTGTIDNLRAELNKILQVKSVLEASVTDQENAIKELKTTAASAAERFLQENSSLKEEILRVSELRTALEAKLITIEGELNLLKAEKAEASDQSEKQIENLNKSIYELNVKVEILMSEKENLAAKVVVLSKDLQCRDESIIELNNHLHDLHLEHVKLIKEIEEAQRTSLELRGKVKELEEEVDKQKLAVLDGAEGKREAIRQLCFSLEHYRDGYKELRQVIQGHKRHTVMAV